MSDATATKGDLQEALDSVVAKKGQIGNKVDTEVNTLKLEQGRLSSCLNNIQTQVLDSKGRFSSDAFSNSGGDWPPHKFRFPKYDGSNDPFGRLHEAEQFFLTQGTPEDQKVWTASFYIKGDAEQWYYRFQKNIGATPNWDQFVEGISKRFGLLCTAILSESLPIFVAQARWRNTRTNS